MHNLLFFKPNLFVFQLIFLSSPINSHLNKGTIVRIMELILLFKEEFRMNRQLPNRSIICIDMKCFYASCIAMLEGLDVMKVPMAVVANFEQPGSVVLAASPPLKEKYQIQTGSRKYEIPNDARIRLFKPKMAFFIDMAIQIAKVIADFVPRKSMYVYSIDEIFVDLTHTKKLWGRPEQTARTIQQAIFDQFCIRSSVGFGPNMLLAKLALDLEAKKSGFAKWTYEDVKAKLWKVTPLSTMWGIGKNLEKQLHQLGIHSIGDLATTDITILEKKFGMIGRQLYYHAWGIDLSALDEPVFPKNKSLSKGQVLLRDYHRIEDIEVILLEMCEDITKRARDAGYVARTISLSLSYSKYTHAKEFRHSTTLSVATNETMIVYRTCQQLLRKHFMQFPVRQISISISNIAHSQSVQLDLFDTAQTKRLILSKTVDRLKDRFGPNAILRAVSYTEAGTAIKRNQLVGGHLV